MATPRTTRSSSSSTPTQQRIPAPTRSKSSSSSGKKRISTRQTNRRTNGPASYSRSIATIRKRVAAIKRKLIEGASAAEIIDDFFDDVAGEPGFSFELYLGPDWLHDAIARACEEVLDKPTGESTVLLVAVPQHQLLHGSVVLDGYMGSVVYFEDIRLGAVALFPDELVDTSFYLRLVLQDERDWVGEPPS